MSNTRVVSGSAANGRTSTRQEVANAQHTAGGAPSAYRRPVYNSPYKQNHATPQSPSAKTAVAECQQQQQQERGLADDASFYSDRLLHQRETRVEHHPIATSTTRTSTYSWGQPESSREHHHVYRGPQNRTGDSYTNSNGKSRAAWSSYTGTAGSGGAGGAVVRTIRDDVSDHHADHLVRGRALGSTTASSSAMVRGNTRRHNLHHRRASSGRSSSRTSSCSSTSSSPSPSNYQRRNNDHNRRNRDQLQRHGGSGESSVPSEHFVNGSSPSLSPMATTASVWASTGSRRDRDVSSKRNYPNESSQQDHHHHHHHHHHHDDFTDEDGDDGGVRPENQRQHHDGGERYGHYTQRMLNGARGGGDIDRHRREYDADRILGSKAAEGEDRGAPDDDDALLFSEFPHLRKAHKLQRQAEVRGEERQHVLDEQRRYREELHNRHREYSRHRDDERPAAAACDDRPAGSGFTRHEPPPSSSPSSAKENTKSRQAAASNNNNSSGSATARKRRTAVDIPTSQPRPVSPQTTKSTPPTAKPSRAVSPRDKPPKRTSTTTPLRGRGAPSVTSGTPNNKAPDGGGGAAAPVLQSYSPSTFANVLDNYENVIRDKYNGSKNKSSSGSPVPAAANHSRRRRDGGSRSISPRRGTTQRSTGTSSSAREAVAAHTTAPTTSTARSGSGTPHRRHPQRMEFDDDDHDDDTKGRASSASRWATSSRTLSASLNDSCTMSPRGNRAASLRARAGSVERQRMTVDPVGRYDADDVLHHPGKPAWYDDVQSTGYASRGFLATTTPPRRRCDDGDVDEERRAHWEREDSNEMEGSAGRPNRRRSPYNNSKPSSRTSAIISLPPWRGGGSRSTTPTGAASQREKGGSTRTRRGRSSSPARRNSLKNSDASGSNAGSCRVQRSARGIDDGAGDGKSNSGRGTGRGRFDSFGHREVPPSVLDASDRGVIKRCVRCCCYGSFIPRLDFRMRIGLSLTEARHLYDSMCASDAWATTIMKIADNNTTQAQAQQSHTTDSIGVLVHNCMSEILRGSCTEWGKWFNNVSRRRVEEVMVRVCRHIGAIGMMIERNTHGLLVQLPVKTPHRGV